MMLAVTVRAQLEGRYGSQGYQQIRTALEGYAEEASARLVALDDAEDMTAMNLPAVTGAEAGTLLLSLRAVRGKLGNVDSILLVGGDGIVPHWRMANPVADRGVDPDPNVLSDNPYGTDADSLEQYLAPPLAVGRLTDFARGSAGDFVQLINLATKSREARTQRSGSVAVTSIDWSDYSHQAAVALPAVAWYFSPGYLMNRGHGADADHEFLYFNLHGFDGKPDWSGYDSIQERFVTAVTPDAFEQQYVSGAVVFAENCYGAQTPGRTPSNSCALSLVQQGAAFVGATGLAFGSYLAPNFFLSDADALARSFWSEFTSGAKLGEALRRARADYLNDPNTPETNPFKQKTLLQFVLLGDPGWN
ncbi:MAG: C25 family cysteine peptidase [Candidatus Sulfotelmatobacter sp.]|jgi:peptidase C25-like protein